MIKINQIHMQLTHTEEDLKKAILKTLRIPAEELQTYEIIKKSVDARKKEISYSYVLAATVKNETRILRNPRIPAETYIPKQYRYEVTGTKPLTHRPVVIGAGPAGLFLTYLLAKEGYAPILLERGRPVEERVKDVERFFETGKLDTESNVQFGEGGAGTFSDGKLNTLIKDKDGKFRFVLDTFVKMGAPEEIRYLNKPHIGTDRLREVVVSMRKEIEACGGEVHFGAKVSALSIRDSVLVGVTLADGRSFATEVCVLAIGHSARDTFEELQREGVVLEPKAFAVGVRVQHPRTLINEIQYGDLAKYLPTADYKVVHQCANGRGVYSFCMCPGGFVVNASSEEGRLAINGMSNHDRMADNSNSAIVVTVGPEDYVKEIGDRGPLIGMYYQRYLEELAYRAGDGCVPTQRYEDFKNNIPTAEPGTIAPCGKGAVTYTNIRSCLPEVVSEAILEGMQAFDKKMPGFAHPDTLLSIIESRTSSPIRILRDETCQAVGITGLYPCGEGAGYAGGITSAAMDGIRIFEEIIKQYKPIDEEKSK